MPDEKKIPDVKAPDTKTPTPAKSETDKKSDAPKEGATASKKSDTPKKDTADSKVTSPAKPATDRKSDAPKKDATDPKVAPTKPTADKKADTAKKDTTDSKSTHPDKSDTDKPPVEEPIDPKKVQIPVGMTATVKVTSVPLSQLHRFEGHPFKVEDNKDMWDLVESIKQFGVMEPAVAIPRKEGGFEIVSGHRRMRLSARGAHFHARHCPQSGPRRGHHQHGGCQSQAREYFPYGESPRL